RGDKVRLGITAPTRIAVHRKEVYEAIKAENQRASQINGTHLSQLGRTAGTVGPMKRPKGTGIAPAGRIGPNGAAGPATPPAQNQTNHQMPGYKPPDAKTA